MAPPSTRLLTTLVALAAAAFCATPARAAFAVTGDPIADGWGASVGNSLHAGQYIRGDGNFSFDMYRVTGFVTQLTGLNVPGWLPGDTVIAMGGVIVNTAPAGFSGPSTGAVVNSNLTQHVRIVSKFTNTTNGYTPSTVAPILGDGAGGFSNGDGGVGSVLIATTTDTYDTNGNPLSTQQVTTAGAGILTLANINQRWTPTGTPPISDQNARFIYTIDPTNDRLKSWEVFLNTSRLGLELGTNVSVPDWGGHWNQSLQRGTGDATDAINQHFPLPPTLIALAAGAGLLGLGRRLRRAA